MREHSQGQNRAAIILIGVGVVFLVGQIFGFSVIDLFGSVFGSIIGAVGTVIGSVMGAVGSLIGAIFGTLGTILGTVFGGLGSIIGDIFGTFGRVADIGWPMFILLPGLLILAGAFFGPVSLSGLAVLGSVVTGTGLILMFQQATGRFETWAYLWGLYPAFVGAAMLLMSSRQGNPALANSGRTLIRIGLMITLGFGLFFEMIFSGGFDVAMRYAIPAALILGGYLMLRRREPAPAYGKAKNDLAYAAPLSEKPKNNSKYGISPSLERQIEEALGEDDTL